MDSVHATPWWRPWTRYTRRRSRRGTASRANLPFASMRSVQMPRSAVRGRGGARPRSGPLHPCARCMRRAAADGKPRPARVRYASPACRARENALRVITDAWGECVPSATAAERISHSPGAWLTTIGTAQASGRGHRMSRMRPVHGWQPPGGVQPVRASPPAISYSSRASLTTVGPSGGRCLAPHSASCLGGSLSNPIGPSEPFARRISATARCGWGGRPASTHPGSAGTRWAAACDREGAAATTTMIRGRGGRRWVAGCERDRRCEPERTTGLPKSGRRGHAATARPPHHRRHTTAAIDTGPASPYHGAARSSVSREPAPRPTGGGTREW